jgi:hypothetical protein
MLGANASDATGALGISSWISATPGRFRRTATSMPPALTFKAVANSRNSFPFSSRLRTKTGMARGNLAHFRRSVLAQLNHLCTSVANASADIVGKPARNPGFRHQHGQNPHQTRALPAPASPSIRTSHPFPEGSGPFESARFCYTWVISVTFFVDNKIGLHYDFLTVLVPLRSRFASLPV